MKKWKAEMKRMKEEIDSRPSRRELDDGNRGKWFGLFLSFHTKDDLP